MPPKNPLTPRDLQHTAYSVTVTGPGVPQYQGRDRIDSLSEKLQGGVFYPDILSGMEAIVVDYEKDARLGSYLDEVETHIQKISNALRQSGRQLTFEEVLKIISAKVASDFPYSIRMTSDDAYRKSTYPPGGKVHLGRIMQKQDMVCRHYGLLAGVVIDYLKNDSRPNKKIGLKPDTEIRFMADMQRDLDETDSNGHAYLVVRKPVNLATGNNIFIVDPTSAGVYNLKELQKSKDRRRLAYYRYLFSGVRFMLQSPNPGDDEFLIRIFQDAETDSETASVLKDVRVNLHSRGNDALLKFGTIITRAGINAALVIR